MAFKYTLTHEHRFGTDVTRFTSPVPLGGYFYTEGFEEALCEKLGIDYEPHREEVLTIAEDSDKDVIELSLEQVREIVADPEAFKTKE